MAVIVSELRKNYIHAGQTIEVLKSDSFRASPGERIAIVGKSGSGKSTLLALMAALDRPDSGSIQVGHVRLENLDEDQKTYYRRNQLGIVFQQFHLMQDLTAFENVVLPLELSGKLDHAAKSRALKLMQDVGLSDRHQHFPSQLSGGESQRVAIARALLPEPELILADEPTGNLDELNAAMVSEIIFEMSKSSQSVLLLVTHNEQLAQKCDRILRLESGILK